MLSSQVPRRERSPSRAGAGPSAACPSSDLRFNCLAGTNWTGRVTRICQSTLRKHACTTWLGAHGMAEHFCFPRMWARPRVPLMHAEQMHGVWLLQLQPNSRRPVKPTSKRVPGAVIAGAASCAKSIPRWCWTICCMPIIGPALQLAYAYWTAFGAATQTPRF